MLEPEEIPLTQYPFPPTYFKLFAPSSPTPTITDINEKQGLQKKDNDINSNALKNDTFPFPLQPPLPIPHEMEKCVPFELFSIPRKHLIDTSTNSRSSYTGANNQNVPNRLMIDKSETKDFQSEFIKLNRSLMIRIIETFDTLLIRPTEMEDCFFHLDCEFVKIMDLINQYRYFQAHCIIKDRLLYQIEERQSLLKELIVVMKSITGGITMAKEEYFNEIQFTTKDCTEEREKLCIIEEEEEEEEEKENYKKKTLIIHNEIKRLEEIISQVNQSNILEDVHLAN